MHLHAHAHTSTCRDTYTYMHRHMHRHITHTFPHTYTCDSSMYAHIHICIYTYTYTYMHILNSASCYILRHRTLGQGHVGEPGVRWPQVGGEEAHIQSICCRHLAQQVLAFQQHAINGYHIRSLLRSPLKCCCLSHANKTLQERRRPGITSSISKFQLVGTHAAFESLMNLASRPPPSLRVFFTSQSEAPRRSNQVSWLLLDSFFGCDMHHISLFVALYP